MDASIRLIVSVTQGRRIQTTSVWCLRGSRVKRRPVFTSRFPTMIAR
jgi:hypothetical protein